MPAGSSTLRLLHPKWLVLHVLTVAASYIMILLGRWQWRVAHQHHGDIRYYAYAFQWWAFVGFALLMWYRIILDYRRKVIADQEPAKELPAPEPRRYLAYTPPATRPVETDPERLRFNAYLADLHAADPPVGQPLPANQLMPADQLLPADRKSVE